jgi:hypothetical protein
LFALAFRLVVLLIKYFFQKKRKSYQARKKGQGSEKKSYSQKENIIDAEYEEIE